MSDPHDEAPRSHPTPESNAEPSETNDNWIEDIVPDSQDSEARSPYVRKVDPVSPIVLVETAFLASAASLIWLVNSYFPMGPILQVFFPVPIALIYLRWGNRAAWMGALVSGLLLSVLIGPVRSIQYVMPFGVMGVLLGTLWYRRANWATSIAIATLLGVFGAFFRIGLLSVLSGDDLWLYGTNQITNLLEWLFVKLGLLMQPSLPLVQAVVVGMIFVQNMVYLFAVHLVSWFLCDRLNTPIPRPPHWVQVLLDSE
jgi:uncharacterized protein YybS (DUF2232 family)